MDEELLPGVAVKRTAPRRRLNGGTGGGIVCADLAGSAGGALYELISVCGVRRGAICGPGCLCEGHGRLIPGEGCAKHGHAHWTKHGHRPLEQVAPTRPVRCLWQRLRNAVGLSIRLVE